jgi:hypothetical protein
VQKVGIALSLSTSFSLSLPLFDLIEMNGEQWCGKTQGYCGLKPSPSYWYLMEVQLVAYDNKVKLKS